MAVSYTHLDVYKRQAKTEVRINKNLKSELTNVAGETWCVENKEIFLLVNLSIKAMF